MAQEDIGDFQFENVDGLEHHGRFFAGGFIRSIPDSFFMSSAFKNVVNEICDMQIHSDDTWVVTFPKCGTTWTQEMVWLIKNDLDFDKAKAVLLVDRFPFIEASAIAPDFMEFLFDEKHPANTSVEEAKKLPRPRLIKTHLPKKFLPKEIWTKKPKIIYVSREVKDVIVSYFHHNRLFDGYSANFETFCRSFMKDEISFCPYWNHASEFWKLRNEPNVLFITYEEMQKDLAEVVLKVAKFLEKDLDADEVEKLCQHLDFKQMKNNQSVNSEAFVEVLRKKNVPSDNSCCFIREGKSGGWKKEMSDELAQEVDEWLKNKLKGTQYYNEIYG